jgi:hypothetical protein
MGKPVEQCCLTPIFSGTIADVHQFKGGSIVLNFGNPNQDLEVYIPKNLVDVTGDMGAVN